MPPPPSSFLPFAPSSLPRTLLLHANAGLCSLAAMFDDLDPVLHFALPTPDVFELEFPPLEPPPPPPPPGHWPSSQHDEERRRRRKISNRESARRSRMRKQHHLEGLRKEADRLLAQNRSFTRCLAALRHNTALFRRDNARIRSDSAALHSRFAEIRRQLYACRFSAWLRQLPPPPPQPSLAVVGSDAILASLMA